MALVTFREDQFVVIILQLAAFSSGTFWVKEVLISHLLPAIWQCVLAKMEDALFLFFALSTPQGLKVSSAFRKIRPDSHSTSEIVSVYLA